MRVYREVDVLVAGHAAAYGVSNCSRFLYLKQDERNIVFHHAFAVDVCNIR